MKHIDFSILNICVSFLIVLYIHYKLRDSYCNLYSTLQLCNIQSFPVTPGHLPTMYTFRQNGREMMQVNLFSSQDNLSPTHRSLSPSSSLKSHCMSLENELSEDLNRADLLSVFNSKPLPTNNNEFPKDIFTITQGKI